MILRLKWMMREGGLKIGQNGGRNLWMAPYLYRSSVHIREADPPKSEVPLITLQKLAQAIYHNPYRS